MRNVKLVALAITLLLSQVALAKSLGNYKSHCQITDKEILFETTNGSKILICANDNYVIQIKILGKNETICLLTPEKVLEGCDLNGSIYTEEIEGKIQVTSTMNDGIFINIEKTPFKLSFLQKEDRTLLTKEIQGVTFTNQGINISFSVEKGEELKLLSKEDYQLHSHMILSGNIYKLENSNNSDNVLCFLSSKGYAIAINNYNQKELNFCTNNQLKIKTIDQEQDHFSYTLFFGENGQDFIPRYAFKTKTNDQQLTSR
jgi:hypothetical protein